jgi:hypothetical protein
MLLCQVYYYLWSNDEAQIFEFKDFTGKIFRAKQLEGNLRNRNPQGLKPLVILEAGGTAEAVPSQSSLGATATAPHMTLPGKG